MALSQPRSELVQGGGKEANVHVVEGRAKSIAATAAKLVRLLALSTA